MNQHVAYNSLATYYPEVSSIPDSTRREVVESSRLVSLERGESVFRSGEACNNFLFLLEGSIRVQKLSHDGHEITLYHITPGQACELSTTCLLADKCYPAEAITETVVHALLVPKLHFFSALANAEPFRKYIFSVIDKGMSALVTLVEEVAFGPMDQRLAQRLLTIKDEHDGVTITHQALAVELGTAREVISRLLKELERKGYVKLFRGRIDIKDTLALERLVAGSLH